MTDLHEDEIKKNVQNKETWMRFVYLVVFCIAFYLASLLTFSISIFQFLAMLFGGKAFSSITSFGENLAVYLGQLTRYLTFVSDEKPFPFMAFPGRKPEAGE